MSEIIGVSTAICMGGFGSIFRMWINGRNKGEKYGCTTVF